ncbi:MAG TPA: acetate/propionate family kinase [Macromonas sp.]|nr:acetate/propionate family kinase [Macromonas sp.]
MAILSVNAGSSSLKFGLYPLAGQSIGPASLVGNIEGLQPGGQARLCWRNEAEGDQALLPGQGMADALAALDNLLQQHLHHPLQAIAHRVVHGGRQFRQPVRVDDTLLQALDQLCPLAPLHQPHNLAGIRHFQQRYPQTPQVACFDTAFHASLPEQEYLFALPPSFNQQGVRRYGFHGLSYAYVQQTLQRVSQRAQERVLMAHLGNGASLCATHGGQSIATTMGFSALDGLMMGTRSGSLDAGVLLHLLAQGWDAGRIETLLYKESGLKGVSGLSADMRTLRASADPAAQRAIALFTHRVVREAGALTACLGGLDVLAFTGGIGEHDRALRADACARLAYLGVRLDATVNESERGDRIAALHAPDSAVEVWLVPTDEGRMAAQGAASLLSM